ncbi:cAMP-dependent protein kinase catalytic subunit-like [Teleopsis dalmanni]|uniref:cAMP-dependent protein kinase catalytic subunit-like n=1 Tax=Teleopsis dalmanni TaxID=139649 RepID=UPI0018CD0F07|nr:cAMP-dependent protein kinase catalytic subunit-like [Teleopsis dalmanni]
MADAGANDLHEAPNSLQSQNNVSAASAASAATHPLQDIELTMDEPDSSNASHNKTNNKENWVKFDDEVNENTENNNNNNNGNSGGNNKATNNSENITREKTKAAQSTSTSPNKLLPPPRATHTGATAAAAVAKPITSATATHDKATSNESKQQQQQTATSAPAQRSPISSKTLADVAPAVLTTESTHVNLNASGKPQQNPQQQQHQKSKPANVLATSNSQQHNTSSQHHSNNGASNVTIPIETAPPMRTIELSTGRIREGFANGDVIVTLLPANTKWPWITPAIFRPELVPEELMAQGLTLTVEEYVQAMETLVNDYRFTVYNICYKRILVCWILFAFAVLLTLLFSGLQGVALFSLGVGWLFLNAAAIFLCMWVKLRLSRGLEKCLARVNKQLMKHKILLVLDDRGRISCHKVNLCFLYFDATQCVNFLNEFLEHTEQNGGERIKAGWEAKLDIDVNDIVIQGTNPVRLSRKQERGTQLFLRYGSRWGMEALRGLVDVTPLEPGRHCGQFQCPCQYIKDHLQCKPRVTVNSIGQVVWTRFPLFA